ncbi:hypothetical protein Nepgr_018837 [Nepenthes gracilis]|uniref:Uncharacterized protein n=1 Tax=Nepenthes gracilis TaxID=150966 RepID=A0AAD3XUQ2_NEPGR|nr:hypothetical protein Nepgr_018837 [Nepenthes gracilis]
MVLLPPAVALRDMLSSGLMTCFLLSRKLIGCTKKPEEDKNPIRRIKWARLPSPVDYFYLAKVVAVWPRCVLTTSLLISFEIAGRLAEH